MTHNFISDLHFLHRNILKPEYDNRPFATIEEHDETIVTRWNGKVKPGDMTYLIGDSSISNSWQKIAALRRRLNGTIHLIYGNHDDVLRKHPVYDVQKDAAYIKLYGQKIHLTHYPMLSWRAMANGSWHLHGHCHTGQYNAGNRLEVSCNLHNYTPLDFEEVRALIEAQNATETE